METTQGQEFWHSVEYLREQAKYVILLYTMCTSNS